MIGTLAIQEIEAKRARLDELSRKIWEKPEAGFKEYEACKNVSEFLREEGFTVEVGVGGVPTAIKASYGSGHPVIGFMGEFDALPGLNQKVSTEKEAFVEGAYGHGCGHNLLCTAHVGAVVGLKEEMARLNLPGTIVYYACPGEELLTGKPLMARGGAFEGLDVAINFHPNKVNEATVGVSTAVNSMKFHFTGKSAHAANSPENGRSALDAVELTDIGANYLREHVTSDVRIHYTITDGGIVPNVVPDKASVWYYVRAFSREAVEDAYERLIKAAKGAAMMTETEVVWKQMLNSNIAAVDWFFSLFGLNASTLLGSSSTALATLAAISIWKDVGYSMIFYVAALMDVPKSYYEASQVDGANGWQEFFRISLPMVKPTTVLLVFMGITGSFQVFELIYTLTGGGPGFSTTTIVMYAYNLNFKSNNAGYAMAVSNVLLLIVAVLSILQRKMVARENLEY